MKAKDEILQLGAQHSIETPHMAHVTELATALYDGFSPLPGMQEKDRDLLFAAASLHDIGYAEDPEHHVETGVSILLAHPLSCFSPKEWRAITAVVWLHQRDWRAQLENEWFAAFGRKQLERIKTLAAILRIADGLDHGRIQDTRVLYCKRGKRSDKVGIGWKWYPNNIPWAEAKADLWEAIFRRPFKFESRPEPGRFLFSGAVDKKDNALTAARKLLNTQYALMRDSLPGMLETGDPGCLHDYRVAMRRFRVLLRVFKSVLPEKDMSALDRNLGRLLDRLGPIRDAHVQLDIFRSIDIPGTKADQVRRFLEAEVEQKNAVLAKLLRSSECRNIARRMGRFLRVEIPAKERDESAKPCPKVVEKHLHKALAPLPSLDISAIRENPAVMHDVRKHCRHGHYSAQFAAPALGEEIGNLTDPLGSAAAALGHVRDIHLQIGILKDRGLEDVKGLDVQSEEAWRQFFEAWQMLIKRVKELK
jgi:CHAD domain-containing protein